MRFLGLGFGLLAVAIAAGVLAIPDPLVSTFRAELTAGLILASVVAAFVAWRVRRRRVASVFLVCIALAAAQACAPLWDEYRVEAASAEAIGAIGPHFMVGYTKLAEIRDLARRGLIGGVFLTRRNVAGRTSAAVAAEIAGLQALRRVAGRSSLIVSGDQEGGPVSSLSPPLPTLPALSSLVERMSADPGAARALGRSYGAELTRIGVSMDLAPVVDLTPSVPPGWLDWHTRIGTRSISADPTVTAAIAAGFAEGLAASGVTPTAKHFPGLGRVASDTHLFAASLTRSPSDLEAEDWIPFRAVLSLPGAAVMLSHVALDALDPGVPASRSRRVVDGLLRQDWHFDGIAVTDDLTMGAVVHAGLCRAVEGAINAGVDLLLVSWDTGKVYPALRCALAAYEAGRLDRAMLEASARRLAARAH